VGLKEIECDDVDCIHLAQDRDQWRTLENTVMKLYVSFKDRKFLDKLSDY